MNTTQLFIEQKTREAITAIDSARRRAVHEHTLLGLSHLVSRLQVNQLVKALPTVRAATIQLRSQTERQAARLASELVARFEAEPHTQMSWDHLHETLQACRGVFPREAVVLDRALEAERLRQLT